MSEQRPVAPGEAWRAVAACILTTLPLLARRRVRLPKERLWMRLRFADGTSARVYRETRLGSGLAKDPCTLVVEFRLRLIRGPAHALFRAESLLNTPCSSASPGSPRSCGWPTTSATVTAVCTSGMARSAPNTMRVPCGGFWLSLSTIGVVFAQQLSSSASDLLVQVFSGRPPQVAGKRRCRWALPGCASWMNWWSVSTIKIVCWGWWSVAGRQSGRAGCTGSP